MKTPLFTVAICSYNRAPRLPKLIRALRTLPSPMEYEVLIINNNSSDNTLETLSKLQAEPGAPLRVVTETTQGIPFARNRALEESMNSKYMLFMDDDELPHEDLIKAALDSLAEHKAQCVGGKVVNTFEDTPRPSWLIDELLGFLAETNWGDQSFWIDSRETPIWTANVAYDMQIFRDDPSLRFDARFNRGESGIGGGEDTKMFRDLLERKIRIHYNPQMMVTHQVESWRLAKSYFLKLHYLDGARKGLHELDSYDKTIFGFPPFLARQFFAHAMKTIMYYITFNRLKLRQAMNAANALGLIHGYRQRNKST